MAKEDFDDGQESGAEEPQKEVSPDSEEGDVSGPLPHENFPTLELTLEEARRRFDDEELRRETVESKIGIVVTVDALLISFGALVSQELHPLALVLVLLPALASAGYGLHSIRSRDYDRPGKEIDDFHEYGNEYDDVEAQRERHLLDYEDSVKSNIERNERKFKAYNRCIKLTTASLILLLFMPVADYFGAIDWAVKSAKLAAFRFL